MWWWRWWQGCGGGGGGGGGKDVVVEVVAGKKRSVPRRGSKKTWAIVCVVKRSRRPFLMKGLQENKQAATSKRLSASAQRRHKWPEAQQTPPK
ncbi:hypothetical protein HanRHA438_Chr05g0208841 [Helianthus annuus]|nr:hypothetical protein HanIR_Chr05g0214931 [Helianthus annuus]KAJ0917691.1 hypothetical protein HanRHA438_Chr05g0208841 [Helianthus annuus]